MKTFIIISICYIQDGKVCGDTKDLVNGAPTGSIRVSFGYASTYKDADTFLRMIKEAFVDGALKIERELIEKTIEKETKYAKLVQSPLLSKLAARQSGEREKITETTSLKKRIPKSSSNHSNGVTLFEDHEILSSEGSLILTDIVVFPVKSCGGMSVKTWPMGERGLYYDREWMVVNKAGCIMTQKRAPQMCRIKPIVDMNEGLLTLTHDEGYYCEGFF